MINSLSSNQYFIMTTHWDNHWDNVKSSSYTNFMIKNFDPGILNVGKQMDTIFIKVKEVEDKIFQLERVWEGKSIITSIVQVDNNKDRYYFDVKIYKQLSEDEFYSEFSSIAQLVMTPGWYLATKLWRL